MSRRVRLTVLCEDKQHEVFARRFFKTMGWDTRDSKFMLSPSGRGSGEQFVRNSFPKELVALRSRPSEAVYLVVLIDGDAAGVRKRRQQIGEECLRSGVEPPNDTERVLICVPTWNVETWLAYLDGETIDEGLRRYPKLTRQSECQLQVVALAALCRDGALREPAPASLAEACSQYRRVFDKAARAN